MISCHLFPSFGYISMRLDILTSSLLNLHIQGFLICHFCPPQLHSEIPSLYIGKKVSSKPHLSLTESVQCEETLSKPVASAITWIPNLVFLIQSFSFSAHPWPVNVPQTHTEMCTAALLKQFSGSTFPVEQSPGF